MGQTPRPRLSTGLLGVIKGLGAPLPVSPASATSIVHIPYSWRAGDTFVETFSSLCFASAPSRRLSGHRLVVVTTAVRTPDRETLRLGDSPRQWIFVQSARSGELIQATGQFEGDSLQLIWREGDTRWSLVGVIGDARVLPVTITEHLRERDVPHREVLRPSEWDVGAPICGQEPPPPEVGGTIEPNPPVQPPPTSSQSP